MRLLEREATNSYAISPPLGHGWSSWHHTIILIPGFLQASQILEPGRIQTVGTPPQSPCWKWLSFRCTWGRRSNRAHPDPLFLHHHTLCADPKPGSPVRTLPKAIAAPSHEADDCCTAVSTPNLRWLLPLLLARTKDLGNIFPSPDTYIFPFHPFHLASGPSAETAGCLYCSQAPLTFPAICGFPS